MCESSELALWQVVHIPCSETSHSPVPSLSKPRPTSSFQSLSVLTLHVVDDEMSRTAPIHASRRLLAVLLLLMLGSTPLWGGALPVARVLEAAPIDSSGPQIDGHLDEPMWDQASVATDFVQLRPDEGDPASERTVARVLSGPDAIYVGIRAYDSNADRIEGQLTRRDQGSFSDWVHVAIDSYNDRRTAFQFGVNPMGVKRDSYRFDDTREDRDWDAVWDVGVSVDDEGWTAEFRIPYSQLRFSASEENWGIQFIRWIARKNESTYWAPLSGEVEGMVSRFGRLRGIESIERAKRLEIVPYTVGRVDRTRSRSAAEDAAFPSLDDPDSEIGLDLKFGLTSNLTMDVTLNPDFGQVEADPSEVNLSEFETRFEERRPFFIEGSNIFQFGIGGGDRLFYSRRIGRAPQGSVGTLGGQSSRPANTTILSAEKLSGKTESGWTLGLLHAMTDEEQASIVTGTGEALRQVVEPAAHFAVARLQKDFRDGRSAVGTVLTATSRSSEAELLDLHSEAFTGGFDFRHRFGEDNYSVSGYFLGSRVSGTAAALERTQLASSRYYQRPDADYVSFDPTRTSLSGYSAELELEKIGGGFWRYGTGLRSRSPGFEANDVGFMRRADRQRVWTFVEYDHYLPTRRFQNWRLRGEASYDQTFGGERTGLDTELSARAQFSNFWNSWAGLSYDRGSWNVTALRGGPALRESDRVNGWIGFATDGRKKLGFNMNTFAGRQTDSENWWYGFSPNVSFRPAGRIQASLGGFLRRNSHEYQWVTRVTSSQDHFIVSGLEQETVGLTARMDLAFTPNLSLQVYAQPFFSAGDYDDLKSVADPGARDFDSRFARLATQLQSGVFITDVDGDGVDELISDPSFNFKQFRSNTVLRWEYRPGSALFVVWSQGREDFDSVGELALGDDFEDLFRSAADDVFLVKLSYWLNPGHRGPRADRASRVAVRPQREAERSSINNVAP